MIYNLMEYSVEVSIGQAKTHLRYWIKVCRNIDVQFAWELLEQRLPFLVDLGLPFSTSTPKGSVSKWFIVKETAVTRVIKSGGDCV